MHCFLCPFSPLTFSLRNAFWVAHWKDSEAAAVGRRSSNLKRLRHNYSAHLMDDKGKTSHFHCGNCVSLGRLVCWELHCGIRRQSALPGTMLRLLVVCICEHSVSKNEQRETLFMRPEPWKRTPLSTAKCYRTLIHSLVPPCSRRRIGDGKLALLNRYVPINLCLSGPCRFVRHGWENGRLRKKVNWV